MTMGLLSVALPLPVVWEIDGLRLNTRDSYGCEWVVDTESGWAGSAAPRTSRTPKVNAHGSFRTPAFRDPKIIALSGYCAAPTAAERRRAEHRIAGVCGGDPRSLYRLICHEERGALYADVELDDEVTVTTRHQRWFEWSLQVAAPDGRKHAVETHTVNTGLPMDAGDGLNFEYTTFGDTSPGLFFGSADPTDGLEFGSSNASGFVILTNRGSAPAYPIYTIRGPLTDPTLTASTGTMRYNAILAEGERVVIDPSIPAVLLGGSASRRHLLYPAQFQAFAIPPATSDGQPGQLAVGLTHSGPVTDAGWFEATYRSAWF